MKETATG